MPFTLPSLETLKVNTDNLDRHLNTLLGRYQLNVVADSSGSKPSTLEVLIARTNKLADNKTDRKDQLAVFSKLVNDLRRFTLPDADETDKKLAPMVLLGALIHRYFRLIKHYETWQQSSTLLGYSLFRAEGVTTCKLFIGIREALQLPSDISTFKENDLKTLDEVTVVTALERFQEYMYTGDRFKEYEHFKAKDNGTNFKAQLQEIITEHKENAGSDLTLFNAIVFLQSLEKKLQEEHQKISAGLDTWFKLLKVEHKDFSRLPVNTIKEHVRNKKNVPDPFLQDRILKLLDTPLINELLYDPESDDEEAPVTTTPEQFLLEMKNCNSRRASFALVGGYTLILELTEKLINELGEKYRIDKTDLSAHAVYALLEKSRLTPADKLHLTAIGHFRYCLHQALSIEDNPDELIKKDKSRGLLLLNEFLETGPELAIQCFGSMPKLEREVALLRAKLSKPDVKPLVVPESVAKAAESSVVHVLAM